MKKTTALMVGLPILGLVAAYMVWIAMPKDISYHARAIAAEYGDRDADRLYSRIFEFEREKGLTSDEFRTIYSQLVLPRLEPFRTVEPIEVFRTNQEHADATQDYVDEKGHRFTIELPADLTPDGGRLNLFDVLKPAWYANYVHRTGEPITEANFGVAVSEGLSRDIPALKRLGVQRFWVSNPDGKGQSLENRLRFYQARVVVQRSGP